jgi:hypothetical protein
MQMNQTIREERSKIVMKLNSREISPDKRQPHRKRMDPPREGRRIDEEAGKGALTKWMRGCTPSSLWP